MQIHNYVNSLPLLAFKPDKTETSDKIEANGFGFTASWRKIEAWICKDGTGGAVNFEISKVNRQNYVIYIQNTNLKWFLVIFQDPYLPYSEIWITNWSISFIFSLFYICSGFYLSFSSFLIQFITDKEGYLTVPPKPTPIVLYFVFHTKV